MRSTRVLLWELLTLKRRSKFCDKNKCHYPKTMRDALTIARLVKRTLPGVPVYTYSAIQVRSAGSLALIDGQIRKPIGARNSAGHFATVAQVFSRLADGASADEIKNEFPGMVI